MRQLDLGSRILNLPFRLGLAQSVRQYRNHWLEPDGLSFEIQDKRFERLARQLVRERRL